MTGTKSQIVICAVLIGQTMVWADDELPKRFNFDRYQKMLDHSPFAVASAVAVPAATPDFARGLYVANAAKTPDADLVTIMSTDDRNLKEYLSTAGPNDHGYSIANIEWSDHPGQTKVTISKDGKFATLTFNQALITSPGPSQPGGAPPPFPQPQPQPQPQQPQPVQGIPQQPFPKPPNRVPPLPNATPHTRGVIPRNPNAAATRQQVPEE
jgi:hypothetical protein